MPPFQMVTELEPRGDQPEAIDQLVSGCHAEYPFQTLLGVTGSGKTLTMAQVIQAIQRPALVLAPNKTLAAQLFSEFRDFFPENAVEYFVSYYDYYQPEAYLPRTDTYIEKDSDVNEEVEKLRLSATRSLLERPDVIIVASVSCIYGMGSPHDYGQVVVPLNVGEQYRRQNVLRRLNDIQYERNNVDFKRGTYRVKGDVLDIFPAYGDTAIRIDFFGDEVDRIIEIDPLTGEILDTRQAINIYPASHFVTPVERIDSAVKNIEVELDERIAELEREGKLLETQRLLQRTHFDLEMLRETGHCKGIENYSRHLDGRSAGDPSWTLLDYFPKDFLMFIDESHVAVPQLRGMYAGDRSRKQVLVDYGFRLPSALDNRPLMFQELEQRLNQVVFVSATPSMYERERSSQVVEQIIRPTGLVDPSIEIQPTVGQIDHLVSQIRQRVEQHERVLVTTLTKRMAEQLAEYLNEIGIKVHYLHSEIDTLERVEILRDLRLGVYDVVVGINLLREGLDLPEVSLVAILDADKEGYLRSETSLVQTIGRAARHIHGHVVLYADNVTDSMRRAIDETYRRREKQVAFNDLHGIEPASVHKAIRDITDTIRAVAEEESSYQAEHKPLSAKESAKLIKELEKQMRKAARDLDFERAALLRDQIREIRAGQQEVLIAE